MQGANVLTRSLRFILTLLLFSTVMLRTADGPTTWAASAPAPPPITAGPPPNSPPAAEPPVGASLTPARAAADASRPGPLSANLTLQRPDGPTAASAVQSAVTWNSFLGGSNPAYHSLTVDGSGNIYVIGTSGMSWGTPVDPFPVDPGGTSDSNVFVAKLNSAGMLMWHTFLGCPGYYDDGGGIAVDSSGNVYVTGQSQCSWGAPKIPWGGLSPNSDGFVAKLNSNGVLQWNTFLGAGSGRGAGIAVDASDAVYVTGDSSTDWGSSPPSFTYGSDAFVAKFSTAGDLLWNGFLGNSGRGIAVDSSGVYVTGLAYNDWGTPPIRPRGGYIDAFVAKLSLDGSFLWHTFLGGVGSDWGVGITTGADGAVYVVGSSINDYGSGTWGTPVRDWSNSVDAFVAKLSADGELTWNTFLGGGYADYAYNLAVDASGNVYVDGESSGPWGAAVTPHAGGGYDASVAKLDNSGALQWNTFLGTAGWDYGRGLALDAAGSNVYVAGSSTASWQGIAPPVRSFWHPPLPYAPDVGYPNVFVARLAPDYQGLLLVGFDGPGVMRSPGQTVAYAASYANLLTETVTSAVLVAQLPVATEYVDSSGGGIYWPERHQVFWKLGDLAPQARGAFAVRARYRWGLPDLYYDGTIAMLAGTNYGQTGLDVTPYLDYVPITITGRTLLTAEQFAAERAAHPDLETLYNRAVTNGYVFREAASFTLSSSVVITRGVLLKPNRSAAVFLSQQGDSSEAATLTRTMLTIESVTGGISADRQTRALEFFGSWAPAATAQASASSAAAGCDYTTCRNNCAMRKVTTRIISAGIEGAAAWVFSAVWPPAGVLAGVWEVIEIVQDISECTGGCDQNPSTHCCTQDAINPTTHPLTGEPACQLTKCADSAWDLLPEYLPCGGWDTRCVAAGGCRSCSGATGQLLSAQGSRTLCAAASDGGPAVSCQRDVIRVARDPNAKYGPEGDLMPGQLISYTITYENEGAGSAFGVYITDQLDEDLNEATLPIQSAGTYTGTYEASSRMIVWDIGELGPKGDPDSKGQVSFTIRLKNDLPGGTAITNEAIVYFPSVPEQTPTGMVVNTVQPVTAVPQNIETPYGQPVTVTLAGHDVGDASLTYTVTVSPLHGELGGVAPTLTYTPAVNFSGGDRFTFQVGNGVSDSRPADVLITVQPSSNDTIAPAVTWVEPAAGATDVQVAVTPFVSNTTGALYRPAIAIVFSETMSRTTVNTATLRLVADDGWTVPVTVTYDGLLNMATVYPQEALLPGTAYTVTVTTGAQDQAGNGLADAYQWSFRTRPMTAPVAGISRTGNAAVLSWQHAAANASYQVWRSTAPYFAPDQGDRIAAGMPPSPNCTVNYSTITCTDPSALATPGSYFYLVQAFDPAGAAATSGRSGAFVFALQPGD